MKQMANREWQIENNDGRRESFEVKWLPHIRSLQRFAINDSLAGRSVKGCKGFTLIEVIVILVVMSILAAVAVPVALRVFETAAEDATREEMINLKKAMIGDSNRRQSATRGNFGFLGDMGRLPINLDELYRPGSLPSFSYDNVKQAGAGWKGPYITGSFSGEEANDIKKDGLGNDYALTVGPSQLDGLLTSSGPDGVPGTADDISLEILPVETTATLRGSVKDALGNGISNVSVNLNFASNGLLSLVTATTDTNGNYSFSSVPFGPRSVQVDPPAGLLVLASGSVSISENGRDISFVVSNISSNPAVIDAIIADFGPRGSTNYDQIRINGRTVDQRNNMRSRQRVSITPTSVGGSPVSMGPQRVMLASSETQLSDFTLNQGAPATFELRRFNRRMNGVLFTVTFLSGGGTLVVGVSSFAP